MKDVSFRSDMTVELVSHNVSDAMVVQAARVSTQGSSSAGAGADAGLIGYLMRNRHGSPFEHGSMTFRIEAPIFVWREFMRHRIGFSYNEESGRYKELEPVFYVPGNSRKLVQIGKPGAYEFVEGSEAQKDSVAGILDSSCRYAYHAYEDMLDDGIAREVARMVLPLNIYSSAYVTCNPRSLMSFLSLRTDTPGSYFPSKPQKEIEMVAMGMQAQWAPLMPFTNTAFIKAGRVAP